MMLVLGGYYFSIGTAAYQALKQKSEWSWVENEVVQQEPDLQFTGPKAETISLDGVIYPHFKGGLLQMTALQLLAVRGVPLLMVDGIGLVLGFWVVESIEESKSNFVVDGRPLKIEFSISLKRFANTLKAIEMIRQNPASALGL